MPVRKIIRPLLVVALFFLSCNASQHNAVRDMTLAGEALQPFGRTLLNADKHIELISSASHVGFTFVGSCQISAYVNSGHNYLQYEMDGVYQKRIKLTADHKKDITITAPDKARHTVWVFKATEAHTGPIFIEKITGQRLNALKRPRAPLIEFIGNSITCGAAADPSEVPCGAGAYHDQHNAYYAYGPRVARALHANFMLSSVSGIGIYRNWNSDGPSMPEVYEKADFQDESTRYWNFQQYKPDVVSIALGTNDFSNGDGKRLRLPFDSAVFVDTYVQFVRTVKGKYPDARVALLSSPMVGGERGTKLQHCITAVKERVDALFPSDRPVAIFLFRPLRARGCTGHPNVEDHALLAEEVTPFFRELLK